MCKRDHYFFQGEGDSGNSWFGPYDYIGPVWSRAVEYMFKLVPSARQESVWMEVFTAAVSYLNRFIIR